MADFFDVNAVGSDSHLQFTNWTVDNNGAYDYAADTRGYTYAAIVEYDTPRWSRALRRGADADRRQRDRHGLEHRAARAPRISSSSCTQPPASVVRLLGYANHANMGSYDEAIHGFLAGHDPKPDVVAYRQPGSSEDGRRRRTPNTRSRDSCACSREPAGTRGTTSRSRTPR